MYNLYNKYKLTYPHYLLLFKSGNFFVAINDDAIILSRLFNYKIIDLNKYLKSGFPITSLKKIEAILSANNINYIIVDNDLIKHKFTHNTYNDYLTIINKYNDIRKRINHINNLLNDKINYLNINNVLDNIERVIYEG